MEYKLRSALVVNEKFVIVGQFECVIEFAVDGGELNGEYRTLS